jgi:hypothetical protein
VKRAHADRIEAAKEAGVVERNNRDEKDMEQTSLDCLPGVTS